MEMDEYNVFLQHSVFAANSLNGRSGDDEGVGRPNTLLEEKVMTNVQYDVQGGFEKGRVGSHTARCNDVSISKGPAEGTARPEPIRSQSGARGSYREETARDLSSVRFVESTPSTLGEDGQCKERERRGWAGPFSRAVNPTGPRAPKRSA